MGSLYSNVDGGKLTLGYKRDSFVRETVITADKKGEVHEDGFVFKVKSAAPDDLVGDASTWRRAAGAPTSKTWSSRAEVGNGHRRRRCGPRPAARWSRAAPAPGRDRGIR